MTQAMRAQSSLAYRVFEEPARAQEPTKTAFVMHGILGETGYWLGREYPIEI